MAGVLKWWNPATNAWEAVTGAPGALAPDEVVIQPDDPGLPGAGIYPRLWVDVDDTPGGAPDYLPTAGGIMTGPLHLNGDPALPQEAATKAYVDAVAAAASAVPSGVVVMWASATIPDGWLLCDGGAVDAGNHPNLRALMANTPDLRGLFVRGGDAPNLVPAGSDTHTLTADELPGHSHALSGSGNLTVTATVAASGGTGENNGLSVAQGAASGRFGHPISATGSTAVDGGQGQPHNNVPRHVVLAYIIKGG